MKPCLACKTDKPLESFSLQKKGKFGRRSTCKACIALFYIQNKKKILSHQKEARSKHPEHYRQLRNESYGRCGITSEKRKRQNEYKKSNGRKLANAVQAHRKTSKLQATPPWANLEKIKQIYLNCPKGFHVDHIIPLKGKNVRGLHVEYNLQYLPAVENIRKGNRLAEGGLAI